MTKLEQLIKDTIQGTISSLEAGKRAYAILQELGVSEFKIQLNRVSKKRRNKFIDILSHLLIDDPPIGTLTEEQYRDNKEFRSWRQEQHERI